MRPAGAIAASGDRVMASLGQPRHAVADLDKTAGGEQRNILVRDGREREPASFDVSQCPAQADRLLEIEIGKGVVNTVVVHAPISTDATQSSNHPSCT